MLTKTTKVRRPTPPALDPSLVQGVTAPPIVEQPEAVVEEPVKAKVRKKQRKERKKQYFDLGAGFQIAHRPGTTYSLFYKLLAEKTHFAEVAETLKSGRYNPRNKEQAKALLQKMVVPIAELERAFTSAPERQEYAKHKTAQLRKRAKGGEVRAKLIFKRGNRLRNGQWNGNIREIISMCLGYYHALLARQEGGTVTFNNNITKFKEAKVVLRRFPLFRGENLMFFPVSFIDTIKTTILTAQGTNEEES